MNQSSEEVIVRLKGLTVNRIGEFVPLSQASFIAASDFVNSCIALNLNCFSIFAIPDGGVQFEWRFSQVTVEVDILNSNEIFCCAYRERDDVIDEMHQDNLGVQEAVNFVIKAL